MSLSLQIDGIMRAYPVIIRAGCIIGFFLTGNIELLTLYIALLIGGIFNYVLKHFIVKPILGNKKLPVFGSGARPNGAKNCGLFLESVSRKSTTYGMPSGHSQEVGFFTLVMIKQLLESTSNIIKYGGIAFFTSLGLGVLYSRVKFGCHTIQQVTVGLLLGLALTTVYYKYKIPLTEKLNKLL